MAQEFVQTYTDTLKDAAGKGIPAVEVVLTSLTGQRLAVTITEGDTNANNTWQVPGFYKFAGLMPGQYVLQYYGEGFSPADNKTINIAGAPSEMEQPSEDELAANLSNFRHNHWASRLLTDVMNDSTYEVRYSNVNPTPHDLYIDPDTFSGSLRVPDGAVNPNYTYAYYTIFIDTTDPPGDSPAVSGVAQATLNATYTIGDQPIKIQTTCNANDQNPD